MDPIVAIYIEACTDEKIWITCCVLGGFILNIYLWYCATSGFRWAQGPQVE